MSESISLNKYISSSGMCSRRQADVIIEEGRVLLNGEVARKGNRVEPGDVVLVDGKKIVERKKDFYIALHKPVGIVCTTSEREPDNIVDYVGFKERIFPIGRLDKMSEGLIFMTNDGDIVNKILRGANKNEKEYIVTVHQSLTEEFLEKMSSGVAILDAVTKPCEVEQLDDNVFRIILTQGLNRQIRRMCEELGYYVRKLKRVRIMNIHLGELKYGKWRYLNDTEVKSIKKRLVGKSKTHRPDDQKYEE